MYKYLFILLAAFTSQSVLAQGQSGDFNSRAYIGLGAADYELNNINDTAYLLYGGWSADYKDKSDIMRLELRYMRAEPTDENTSNGVVVDSTAMNVYQLGVHGIYNFINTKGFGMYVELGANSAKYYVNYEEIPTNTKIYESKRESFFSYGFGFRYNFLDNFSARLSYTIDHIDQVKYDIYGTVDVDKPAYAQFSLDYRF